MNRKENNSHYTILAEVFPWPLLLLCFAPFITGLIMDYDLTDSRYIIINLVWIVMFTIPNALFQKNTIYIIILVLFFLSGLAEMTHWLLLKGPLTLTSLLVLSNTNYDEAREFMDLKASSRLLFLIPYLILFFYGLRYKPIHVKAKHKNLFLFILASLALVFIAENAIHRRLIRKGVPQLVKVTASFVENIKLYQQAKQQNKVRKVDASLSFACEQQTFVLVLGESCSRRHMSLFGYKRNTNPRLGKRNDILLYNNVVSPYCNTLNSILMILSQSNLENSIPIDKAIDIIDIFHSAGFKTYWLSNQSPIGIWDNLVTVFANKSDDCNFVNTSSNSSFEATYTVSYDSKLFQVFKIALEEAVTKKFIVLHLMGSHTSYSKRYPNEFSVFKGDDVRGRTIAEYDNSILYNDYIIDSLINILNTNSQHHPNVISSLVYLSDHGENVYDEFNNCGHDYTKVIPKSNVEIPLLVWLSPAYKSTFPGKASSIMSNTNKPYVSDDLFHCIMDMNGISSPYQDPARSLFNENFNANRKRVLEDGVDYDSMCVYK